MKRLLIKIHRKSTLHIQEKGNLEVLNSDCRKITPAYAGKSPLAQTARRPMGDHPRIRGEKFYLYPCYFPPKGSPPHTRGKGENEQKFPEDTRITPAYAGKR